MKVVTGIIGGIILFISSFLPLGFINTGAITMLPVFGNSNLGPNIWHWQDTAAFSLSFVVASLLIVIFMVKKMRLAALISSVVALITALFVLVSIWMTSMRSDQFPDTSFSYGWGLIILLIGFVLTFAGLPKTEPANHEKLAAE